MINRTVKQDFCSGPGFKSPTRGIFYPVLGVVTNVYYADNTEKNVSANPAALQLRVIDRSIISSEVSAETPVKGARVECDIMVLVDAKQTNYVLKNVPVQQRKTGLNDFSEEFPKPPTNLDQYVARKITLGELDGDWVLVQFIGGRIDLPIVTGWYPHNSNNQDAAEESFGQRVFKRIQGTTEEYTQHGDYILDTTQAGTTVDPKTRERSEPTDEGGDVTINIKKSRTVRIDLGDNNFMTVRNNGDEIQVSINDENGQHAVLGENLLDHLNQMKSTFDMHQHTGNLGAPTPLLTGPFPAAQKAPLLSANLVMADRHPGDNAMYNADADPDTGIDNTATEEELVEFEESAAEGIEVERSPNQSSRGANEIQMIVYHYTATATKSSAMDAMNNTTDRRVSAHYLVDLDGSITQLVADSKKAWHAGGDASYQGKTAINSISIGIEIVNLGWLTKRGNKLYDAYKRLYWEPGDPPSRFFKDDKGKYWASYPQAQLDGVSRLTEILLDRHPTIKTDGLVGHSTVAPQRKVDPGSAFDLELQVALAVDFRGGETSVV